MILILILIAVSYFYYQKLVITTKSVEYMPFFLSLMSLANGVAWTTYAFLPFDQFIAVIFSLTCQFFIHTQRKASICLFTYNLIILVDWTELDWIGYQSSDSKWAGDVIGGGPGDTLCLLLQIHEETDGSKTRQGPGGFVGCCCVRVRLWRFEEDWHRSWRWRLMRVRRPHSILMTVVGSNRGSQSVKGSRICVVLIFKLIF